MKNNTYLNPKNIIICITIILLYSYTPYPVLNIKQYFVIENSNFKTTYWDFETLIIKSPNQYSNETLEAMSHLYMNVLTNSYTKMDLPTYSNNPLKDKQAIINEINYSLFIFFIPAQNIQNKDLTN